MNIKEERRHTERKKYIHNGRKKERKKESKNHIHTEEEGTNKYMNEERKKTRKKQNTIHKEIQK